MSTRSDKVTRLLVDIRHVRLVTRMGIVVLSHMAMEEAETQSTGVRYAYCIV